MACHTPPFSKAKKQRERSVITHPESHLILKNAEFGDEMGLKMGNGISPRFFTF